MPDATPSSGNVFADLGLPDSDELIVKVELVRSIARLAAQRGLTQKETAELLGTTQPKVSALFAGKLEGFSLERLFRFVMALGRDIDIVVTSNPDSRSRGRLTVLEQLMERIPKDYTPEEVDWGPPQGREVW